MRQSAGSLGSPSCKSCRWRIGWQLEHFFYNSMPSRLTMMCSCIGGRRARMGGDERENRRRATELLAKTSGGGRARV